MNPSHPVGVYFETENIYTLDPDCKQNLSIHAMLADWESANKSRRMILSYDQRICTGQYPVLDLLGYRHTKEGELIIQPEEAKTVRFIFLAYIGGYDCDEIAEMINAITEEDIEETGVVVENPVIGHIPSRQEIVNELEELLMTM